MVKRPTTLGSLPTWQVMEAPLLEEGDRETWITPLLIHLMQKISCSKVLLVDDYFRDYTIILPLMHQALWIL